jgi:hypothetical protein
MSLSFIFDSWENLPMIIAGAVIIVAVIFLVAVFTVESSKWYIALVSGIGAAWVIFFGAGVKWHRHKYNELKNELTPRPPPYEQPYAPPPPPYTPVPSAPSYRENNMWDEDEYHRNLEAFRNLANKKSYNDEDEKTYKDRIEAERNSRNAALDRGEKNPNKQFTVQMTIKKSEIDNVPFSNNYIGENPLAYGILEDALEAEWNADSTHRTAIINNGLSRRSMPIIYYLPGRNNIRYEITVVPDDVNQYDGEYAEEFIKRVKNRVL